MNRISAATRWPLDFDERLERAETDISFADAMTKLMGRDRSLEEIAWRAFRIKCDVQDELMQRKYRHRKPK